MSQYPEGPPWWEPPREPEPERAPSREALAALHRAHRRAFSFENLDVLLGQHPGVSLEAVQAKFETLGAEARGSTPQQFTQFLIKEDARWMPVIKQSNISAE